MLSSNLSMTSASVLSERWQHVQQPKMMIIATYLLTGLTTLLAVPTGVFLLEILAAIALPKQKLILDSDAHLRGTVAVLVPAHNESVGLQPTLADIKSQLRSRDRLLVIVDNCTDDTAEVAGAAGAEITVRNDPTKIGKGYALDWGLSYLTDDPPDVLMIIDADCRVHPGAIDRLAEVCGRLQRPVQSLYLMTAPAGSAINHQVAEFAWRIKNWLRPLGLSTLGLPCQLMGSGMAFPWKIIAAADLATGSIVEDLKLGLELAAAGSPPAFCPSAIVTSTFSNSAEGTWRQRQRWEHGHLGLILTKGPPLLFQAIKQGKLDLLALVLDLLVPPLSLLGAILITATLGTGLAKLAGMSSTPFMISWICLIAVLISTVIGWYMHGRELLPPRSLGLVLSYFLTKLRMYSGGAFGGRVSRWIRTDRG